MFLKRPTKSGFSKLLDRRSSHHLRMLLETTLRLLRGNTWGNCTENGRRQQEWPLKVKVMWRFIRRSATTVKELRSGWRVLLEIWRQSFPFTSNDLSSKNTNKLKLFYWMHLILLLGLNVLKRWKIRIVTGLLQLLFYIFTCINNIIILSIFSKMLCFKTKIQTNQ